MASATPSAVVLHVDPDDLTIGELEDFEEIVGKPLDEALVLDAKTKQPRISAKVLKAFIFIVYRRANPDFTLEQARAVKVSELQLGTKPDPTETAGAGV